ncbi:thiamine phosphate synthase [Gilliamella sp. B2894]|uniref:thiamine phosphate synthase n=1 Tax=unclassified Gilliamella TaxID=2685620 RepID=UPI00226A1121|nr:MULTISPECIES: thiamine phosphate synthase [unclassified Gilliamella]MCX8655860.1 thiamine phosphate synthase [Gilliamella sp. B2894]MCX8694595.1 thiamine phosphate synthase [Gilliamella sp. B2881]MCX8695194.1 thiamine phosphate synthase [Gilliamella sp. B2828]
MKKQLDLSLYLVLDPMLCGGIKGMIETTKIAVANGVTAVQLRSEHDFSGKDWYHTALALKELLNDTTVPLLINDHVDIALAVDADGVHIGQSDLPVDVARKLIGDDKWLGFSVANRQQLNAVPWQLVDYIGIGPIYPTTTKQDAEPAIGMPQLSQLVNLKQCPAVAIGGINTNNATQILQTGIEGIAVVSAICGQKNVQQSTLLLLEKIQPIKLR